MGEARSNIPALNHPHVFPLELRKKFNLPSIFYVDLYPVTQSAVFVLDPDVGAEVTADPTMWKHPAFTDHLAPLTGPVNLLLSDGPQWKKQRAMFNPGFSPQHIMSQLPVIIDVAEEFVRALERRADANKVFRLEEEATKISIDVIGRIVLDHDFRSFTTTNEFFDAMRKALSWMPDTQSFNPFHRKNPIRPFAFRHYKRRMDNYIGNVLDERFKVRDANLPKKARKKSSIDLALEAYFKESGQDIDSQIATMDPEFRQSAIDNMLILLFAGHDTTASTICYCYHMLAQHPDHAARLRKELDDVFGAGINAAEKLRQDPYLINKCEYMAAIIKETLRLWSPGSTIRQGRKDYFLKDPDTGEMLPTEGLMVWPVLQSMHRDPHYWGPDAHLFNPSRFLPENIDKITPNAFRPFEKGPRICIGQEVANVELKVVLALTVREFDIRAAYDELDALANDGSLWAAWRGSKSGLQEYYGDPMYQVLMFSAKPREGMPARITRRGSTKA
ncbi:cytochrome P450 [Lentithecium fluviatile CBS 122367]|uniref:Cytochrome P450 n=1 Tax=Lentithecium fluviatile CBS 122367 TaxID=1168545 RepID=A0A6G1ISR6_9PLEO|nr:cytochrome P450 [Lentithecium fluviatile CBS 122367]